MSNYDLSEWPLFRSVIGNEQEDRARPLKCFVASPHASADADVRNHANTLWKYVIRPALLDTDYAARRADADDHAPTASQAAIDALLDDDLVIAILTFNDPLVCYQTAVAQAAAQPLILMIEEGRQLPFEARGAKVVVYSLETDAIFSAVNVRKLQAAVQEIRANDAPLQQGFRPGAVALNSGGNSGAVVYERSHQFTYDQRLNMLREARARIDIMGVANKAFALHPDAIEAIRSHSGKDVEVRILQCAPTNPALPSLIPGREIDKLNAVRDEIVAAAEAWKHIADMPDLNLSITLRRVQTALPLASALITDHAAVSTPYLHSMVTAESPTLVAKSGGAYYRAISREFDALWSEAATMFRVEPKRHVVQPVAVAAAAPLVPLVPANGNRSGDVQRLYTKAEEAVKPAAAPNAAPGGGQARGLGTIN
jgi:hypothetical protein